MTPPTRKPAEKKRLPAPIYSVTRRLRDSNALTRQDEWEAYFIPGTNTLRNKLGSSPRSYGITDPALLAHKETSRSMARMIQLENDPIQGHFDFDHMKAVHRHLFQDVYDWAGQPRTVSMMKQGYGYASPGEIEEIWSQAARKLRDRDFLHGIEDRSEFARGLAETWNEVNYAHAFREGNTRSQAAFFSQLAREAGWELDVARLDPKHPQSVREEFVAARFRYQGGRNVVGEQLANHGDLAAVLGKISSPLHEPQRSAETQKNAPKPPDLPPPPPSPSPSGPGRRGSEQRAQRIEQIRSELASRYEAPEPEASENQTHL